MLALELRIGLRYALIGRGDRFVAFTSLASALGIATGLAAVIIVMAVMNGYHVQLRTKILSASSHLELLNPQGGQLPDWQQVLIRARAAPGVAAAAPLIDRQALLTSGEKVSGAIVKGIVPNAEQKVTGLARTDLAKLKPGSFRILLGKGLANKLGVKAGSKVVLLSPRGARTIAGSLPRLRQMEVAGVITFGVYQYDIALAYIHFEDAMRLYRTSGADSIRLRLNDPFGAPQLASKLSRELGVRSFDWSQSNATLFEALAIERRIMFLILSLIIAVAAFQIVSVLVAMVRSKRGDIAILRTIGLTPAAIMRIFLIQGMLVGLAGTACGVILGLIGTSNINLLVGFLETLFEVDLFPGKVYALEEFPTQIIPSEVMLAATVALVMSLLATLWPSLAAARVDPAEALRYE